MVSRRLIEFLVGVFIILGVAALFLLSLRVSGLSAYSAHNTYKISAQFSNIGDLKVRAPVKVAGVRIGEVTGITLDKKSYKAVVAMAIDKNDNNIPTDSSASILSASLLGSNYISINPGFEDEMLKSGGVIDETNSAVILENLLGQAIFKPKDKKK
ncbi:MAG: outer membrane lipid asymmetry maintenance protein MlaD [Gammaproteobacteria bacterium]|nr:outer membrane lipid asymmetry maintenance protein MlaD [Gammaproteobacteria bacterium]